MRHHQYILDDSGQPVPCEDMETAARWMSTIHLRRLRETYLALPGGEVVRVSSIFTVLNYNLSPDEESPILWETMVFGGPGPIGGSQERFSDRGDALHWHEVMVTALEAAFGATRIDPALARERGLTTDD